MTPQERDLVTDLFDRLATLENAPRDLEAERLIAEGLRQAPNAVYPLVQTVLLQDEALRRANARIGELQSELGVEPDSGRQGSFLDGMRDALFGRRETPRAGSVPSVRPGAPMGVPAGFGGGAQPMAAAPAPSAAGGSFLGTAAAAAAGIIGGSLLLDGIRSMMGHGGGYGMTNSAGAAPSPWNDSSGGELARQAGLNDIGRGSDPSNPGGDSGGVGLFDSPDDDVASNAGFDDFDPGGGFDGGGGDSA